MNDQELAATAERRGWTITRFKLPAGHRFFVKDTMGNVLFGGESFDRKELVKLLQGGPTV